MNIRMRYFAALREIIGLGEETFSLPEGARVADARAVLLARYPRLQLILERSLCAVNRNYVAAETVLHENDELVFIPPMGGGSHQEEHVWSR
ncbi:MAG: MoaD/ThiS family protein [Ktedonobacteraceae bacterium]|nr:MoaD/ThiS family protein [Ktedonobacteraceae bacterium]